MSELIMPIESVIKILNLYNYIERYLTFDEQIALKAYLHGNPTDDQQRQVLYILQAIIASYPTDKEDKHV